jgi:hypothetical protein
LDGRKANQALPPPALLLFAVSVIIGTTFRMFAGHVSVPELTELALLTQGDALDNIRPRHLPVPAQCPISWFRSLKADHKDLTTKL